MSVLPSIAAKAVLPMGSAQSSPLAALSGHAASLPRQQGAAMGGKAIGPA